MKSVVLGVGEWCNGKHAYNFPCRLFPSFYVRIIKGVVEYSYFDL